MLKVMTDDIKYYFFPLKVRVTLGKLCTTQWNLRLKSRPVLETVNKLQTGENSAKIVSEVVGTTSS